MTNPFGLPETVTICGFPLPKYGSLLEEEQDWLRIKEIEQADSLTPFINMAKRVSEEQGISYAEALNLLTTNDAAQQNLPILMSYIEDVQALRNPILAKVRHQTEMIIMLLRSRLDPAWMVANIAHLNEAFPLNLTNEDLAPLLSTPEEKWLSDPIREGIMRRLVAKLPRRIIIKFAEFLSGESSEWATEVEPDDLPAPEDPAYVGKSLPSSRNGSKPSKKTGNSSSKRTTGSKPQGFAIVASTPNTSEDSLAG